MSTPVADRIINWVVHDEDYLSDHKLITFNLTFEKPQTVMFRNFRKANWSNFKHLLSQKSWKDPPRFWSKETIEIETDKLMQDITLALDKVCPIKELRMKTKPPSWWTTELHNLRRKARIAEKIWKKLCSNVGADREITLSKYEAYKSIRKEYFKKIKKSKLSS